MKFLDQFSLSFVSVNKRRISPPNSMPILCDEVVAEVGEG